MQTGHMVSGCSAVWAQAAFLGSIMKSSREHVVISFADIGVLIQQFSEMSHFLSVFVAMALKLRLGLYSLDLCPDCFTPPFETDPCCPDLLVHQGNNRDSEGIQRVLAFLLQMVLKAQRHTYIFL